jgi:CubicO group peptidase (beta-lactamase class C family)
MAHLARADSQRLDAIDQWMSDRLTAMVPGAMLGIALRGEAVFSKTYGMADLAQSRPLTARSQLDSGSVIKVLTGLAVALLEEEGALSAETRLRDLLPDFPPYGDGLRLKHLIHHESGLRNYTVLL